jgi:uncharacterized membrane protein YraQ (UPF0718 family)
MVQTARRVWRDLCGIACIVHHHFVRVHFLQAYVTFENLERWMAKRGGMVGNSAGILLDFVTPFCSCSTISLLVTMLHKRVPFQATMSFLFTSKLLDPWILAPMAWIYGGKTTAVYAAVTFLFSMVISTVVDRLGFARQVKNMRVKRNRLEKDSAARRRAEEALVQGDLKERRHKLAAESVIVKGGLADLAVVFRLTLCASQGGTVQ